MPLKVFKLTVIEGQQSVVPVSDESAEVLVSIDGTPRAALWPTPRVELLVERDDGQPRSWTDFPFLAEHVVVARARAYSALHEPLRAAGEFLPLAFEAEPLWLFNTTRIVPALDLESSKVERLSSGTIYAIDRHVFRPDALAGLLVFKVPGVRTVYMTGDLLSLVDQLGLEGLGASLVWSG
jgi:hypothetical protein